MKCAEFRFLGETLNFINQTTVHKWELSASITPSVKLIAWEFNYLYTLKKNVISNPLDAKVTANWTYLVGKFTALNTTVLGSYEKL